MWTTIGNNSFTKTYYTLKDLMDEKDLWNGNYYYGGIVTDGLVNFIQAYLPTGTLFTATTELGATESNLLWCRYIVPYFSDETALYTLDISSFDTVALNWVKMLCMVFNNTYNKYKPILDAYEAERTHLLDEVASGTTIRFNDTPQNGGDYTSDDYTTNYTKSESTNAIKTPVERLEDIRDKWNNIYETWASEFKTLFFSTTEAD